MHFLILILLYNFIFADNFLKVNDEGNIENGFGEQVLLRGFGLGGWLVQESYMWSGIYGFTAIHSNIKQQIIDLVGEEKASEFYSTYHNNYLSESDIAFIAQNGFNTLRVPFHYKFFSEEQFVFKQEGFEIIDRILEWCREYEVYLVLDMHCAPGAQSHDAPADSEGEAGLWIDPVNRYWTIDIWQYIANYYSEEPWIAGYDLINEPVLSDGFTTTQFRDFYEQIRSAIRLFDQNHIIFIEGNWFGNDFTNLTDLFLNDNMGCSFHHYQGSSDFTSWINDYMSYNEQYNVPLWVGEFGENSNHWVFNKVKLFEQNNIGWSLWNYKHNGSITPLMSVKVPQSFTRLVNYWNGNIQNITSEDAEQGLFDLAEAYKFENCIINRDIINATSNPEYSLKPIPYVNNSIPNIIEAVNYDMGANGVSYFDYGSEDPYKFSSNSQSWNNGWTYRNDGVDIQYSNDSEGSNYNIGWFETGEWLYYTIEASTSGEYQFSFRISSTSSQNELKFSIIGLGYEELIRLPNSNGYQNWTWTEATKYVVPKGEYIMQLQAAVGGFNLKDIKVEFLSEIDPGPSSFSIKNYPNPFNSSTEFLIPDNSDVLEISVYDLMGNLVFSANGDVRFWDGKNLKFKDATSGIYIYKIMVDEMNYKGKMTLLR